MKEKWHNSTGLCYWDEEKDHNTWHKCSWNWEETKWTIENHWHPRKMWYHSNEQERRSSLVKKSVTHKQIWLCTKINGFLSVKNFFVEWFSWFRTICRTVSYIFLPKLSVGKDCTKIITLMWDSFAVIVLIIREIKHRVHGKCRTKICVLPKIKEARLIWAHFLHVSSRYQVR